MDNKQTDNAQYQAYETENSYQYNARPSRRGLFTVIAVIVLLTVAAFFVRDQFLRIKHVEIAGIQDISREEVIFLAGIDSSSTYFSLNENKIREGIDANRYLEFIAMEKVWPDTVILHLNERSRIVNVLYMGVQYVLSEDGMVLENSGSLALDNGCIKVTGMDVRDIRVGAKIVCQNPAQLEVMNGILVELDLQGIRADISELNLADLESIYLVTMDGYTANVGNAEEMRAKIGTVRAVADELRRRHLKGGLIEATVPGQASYRPVQ